MRTRWTQEEDELLYAYGCLGLRQCTEMLVYETGRFRTEEAVKQRAKKLHVSLLAYETCPQCGRTVQRLQSVTGLCAVCHERHLANESRRRREAVERPYSKEDEASIERYRKARDMERKRLQREREKAVDSKLARHWEKTGELLDPKDTSEDTAKAIAEITGQENSGKTSGEKQIPLF